MVEEKVAEQYQYSGLDILKAILAITVVLRHIEQGIGKESLFAFIWGAYLSPVAVPCFFIISGYLFFIKEPTRERLWHQVKRILSLYLWWLILYSPIIIYDWIKKIRNGEILRNLIKHFIQETIFAGGYYHLWYLTSLVVALILIYLLEKFIKDKVIVLICLVAFVIGILVDNYEFMFTNRSLIRLIQYYRNIFLTTRNGIFFAPLFLEIGRILAKTGKEWKTTKVKKLVLVLLILFSMFQFIEALSLGHIYGYDRAHSMMFSVIVTAPCLFILFRDLNLSWCEVIGKKLRNVSTLLYFIHPGALYVYSFLLKVLHFKISTGLCYIITALGFSIIAAIILYGIAQKLTFLKKLY